MEEDKSISTKEIFTCFVFAILLLKKNWKTILLSFLVFTGAGLSFHKNGPYIAPTEIFLTKDSHKINDFVLSDSYSFKYSDSKVTKEEFNSLVSSSKIINRILKQVITVSSKKDTVFNHIIQYEALNVDGGNLSHLNKRNIALKHLRENILTIMDKKSTITLEVLSNNEELGIKVSKLLIDETNDLIKSIGLKAEIKFRKKLEEKIDSLTKSPPLKDSVLVNQLKRQFEVSGLKMARFDSNIEVISLPDYPLNRKGFSLFFYTALYGFSGVIFSSLFILIKNFIITNLQTD